MHYWVETVITDEVPYDETIQVYYYDQDHQLISSTVGVCNGHIGPLNIQIYDEDHTLWYVSFSINPSYEKTYAIPTEVETKMQMVSEPFGDKLLIYDPKVNLIYTYSLPEKKCLNITETHNKYLHDINIDHYTTKPVHWEFASKQQLLIVMEPKYLTAFNVEGMIWQVEHGLSCCFDMRVINDHIIVRQEHGLIYTWTYDLMLGTQLDYTRE